jgi:hypothetical protein
MGLNSGFKGLNATGFEGHAKTQSQDIHVTQFACTSYTSGMAKANTTVLTAVWSLT